MKSVFFLIAITSLCWSCKKDKITKQVEDDLSQGSWKITNYMDSGNNETSDFTSYTFQFKSNGNVSATSGSGTMNGTWSTTNDDSQNKLVINFSSGTLEEISDDWHIIENSSNLIRLEDVSGGNGGTDYLTFEKK